jgi:hypothetical protein
MAAILRSRCLAAALLAGIAAAAACEGRVSEPQVPPASPQIDSVVALDSALWVRWRTSPGAESYLVYRRVYPGGGPVELAGETRDSAFLDPGRTNAVEYAYAVVAANDAGQSIPSAEVRGIPRPDSSHVTIYARSSDPARSGFLYPRDYLGLSTGTVVAYDGGQFTVDVDAAGSWWLTARPLHAAREYGPTTALACGPGTPPGCVAATRAPQDGYVFPGTNNSPPVALRIGYTYVIREMLLNGAFHYGAIRVRSFGNDGQGRRFMTFDWSYQHTGDLRL